MALDEKKILEPCPFCGGDVYSSDMLLLVTHAESKEYFTVICACDGAGPKKDTKKRKSAPGI